METCLKLNRIIIKLGFAQIYNVYFHNKVCTWAKTGYTLPNNSWFHVPGETWRVIYITHSKNAILKIDSHKIQFNFRQV